MDYLLPHFQCVCECLCLSLLCSLVSLYSFLLCCFNRLWAPAFDLFTTAIPLLLPYPFCLSTMSIPSIATTIHNSVPNLDGTNWPHFSKSITMFFLAARPTTVISVSLPN